MRAALPQFMTAGGAWAGGCFAASPPRGCAPPFEDGDVIGSKLTDLERRGLDRGLEQLEGHLGEYLHEHVTSGGFGPVLARIG